MDLTGLFSLQRELDDRIRTKHNLKEKNLNGKKILSLHVEIGELANETRCFKYWSTKPPSPKEIILEEYVDCLHFILSLGLDYNYDDIIIAMNPNEAKLTEQFLNLYIDVTDLVVSSSKDHFMTLFEDFLTIGNSLGFTEEEIIESYYKKNEINHTRQTVGY